MKGSVRKRGTTWSYRIDFGKINGKRNQIEKGGYETKKEAEKAMTDALYLINNTGDYVENKKITFHEVYTEFIETEAPATRAYATIKRYKSLYDNHYKERFGGLYMFQISANMINDFINEKTIYLSEEYFAGLEGTVLDKEADNTVDIDVEAQRAWLAERYDISDYTDDQIRKAKTGKLVFATANVTFCDAIEDLRFTINMG